MNNELGDKDLELFHAWKNDGDKKALKNLVNNLKPIIQSETTKLSGSLPASALKGEVVSWAIRAIKDYDPTKGTKLSTHVYNWTRKAKRLNYTYQNIANMGEDKQLQYGKYNLAATNLEEELGREPTDKEIGHRLGWSEKEVGKYKSLLFQDHVESGNLYAPEQSKFNSDPLKLNYIKSKLSDEELKIFNGRADKVSATEIANGLGMNINQYNYASGKLKDKVQKLLEDYGTWDN
jgi:DNA-directed RNA polymerase specialized sigma subunit